MVSLDGKKYDKKTVNMVNTTQKNLHSNTEVHLIQFLSGPVW